MREEIARKVTEGVYGKGLYCMNFSHYAGNVDKQEVLRNKIKNQSQISFYHDNNFEYYGRNNKLIECMTPNRSTGNLNNSFYSKSRKNQDIKHPMTDHKRQQLLESSTQHHKGEERMRARWDKEAERILNIVREHKEKTASDYNRSKINPKRNGSLIKSVTPKITEASYCLINKPFLKNNLIQKMEEDRKQRHGRKSSGLLPAQKDRSVVLINKISPGKKLDEKTWSESVIAEYKVKLEKLNKMKKVNVWLCVRRMKRS